jgi:hypothetical protein
MFVDFYKVINFGLRLSNASEDDNLDEQTAALYVFFLVSYLLIICLHMRNVAAYISCIYAMFYAPTLEDN